MRLAAGAPGALLGRIRLASIEDAGPSLTWEARIPVVLHGEDATLSVDLLRPGVRTWRGLAGRDFAFDASTRRQGKADGRAHDIDDVFGDLRTATRWYDTSIARVRFGDEHGGKLQVEVHGSVDLAGEITPFSVSAALAVDGVIVEEEYEDAAPLLLDLEQFQPPRRIDGRATYRPRTAGAS